jgi:hypothetical protein
MKSPNKVMSKAMDEIGYRTRITLLSVLVPGLVLVSEGATAWYCHSHIELASSSLIGLTQYIKDNAFVALLILILVLAVSFAVGFLFREIAFTISDAVMRAGVFGRDSLQGVLDRIKLVYGTERVESVLDKEEIFKCGSREADLRLRSPRGPDFFIRNHCKLWLRVHAPAYAIDYLEAEINVFIAFVIPTGLAAVPFIIAERNSFDLFDLVCVTAILLTALMMLAKINAMRAYETELAIANFVVAHICGPAASEDHAGLSDSLAITVASPRSTPKRKPQPLELQMPETSAISD